MLAIRKSNSLARCVEVLIVGVSFVRFGSAMFAIDNALQLASIGFSQVFFHSGGAAARYNGTYSAYIRPHTR